MQNRISDGVARDREVIQFNNALPGRRSALTTSARYTQEELTRLNSTKLDLMRWALFRDRVLPALPREIQANSVAAASPPGRNGFHQYVHLTSTDALATWRGRRHPDSRMRRRNVSV